MAAVVQMTGLNPDTIRAWERRYQLVTPRRDPSGVRVYSDEDIERLELARDATRLGHAIRHVAALANADLRGLLLAKKAGQTAADGSANSVVVNALEALSQYDFASAGRTLTAAALVMPTTEFALCVLAPLLRCVGEEWSLGRLDVAQEHAVSQLIRNLVGSLTLQHSGNATASKPVVFATPPQELHEFGIAIGALIAAGQGFAPCVLGPNVPASDLVNAAKRLHARTVVVGTLGSPDVINLAQFLRDVSGALPTQIDLWIGGPDATALCGIAGTRRLQPLPTLEAFAQRLQAVGHNARS
jgi:DNA-binding transcriptional MerR regulator